MRAIMNIIAAIAFERCYERIRHYAAMRISIAALRRQALVVITPMKNIINAIITHFF